MSELSDLGLEREFSKRASSRIVEIGFADLPLLQSVLNHSKSNDPYQKSAAYFAMTGRRGLWMIQSDSAAVLFCSHPNLENHFLIFPAIGQGGDELLAESLGEIMLKGGTPVFARAEEPPPIEKFDNCFDVQRISEKYLDWAYPVHTLDTSLVSKHKGRKFQNLRTLVGTLESKCIETKALCPATHWSEIYKIINLWSGSERKILEPYERLLELFDILPMQGRLIYYDGKPAGFSIWEETDPKNGMANAHAHIGIHQVSGLSRFVMLDMCQSLEARGFGRVCIGGSETSGLNQFKQQMRPIESIELSSYRITPKPEALRPNLGETSHTKLPAPYRVL